MLRRLLAIAIVCVACGCEDGDTTSDTSGTTTTSTTSDTTTTTSESTTSTSETTTSTTTTTEDLGACLDRPTDLARPPSGKLPCELLPPGF